MLAYGFTTKEILKVKDAIDDGFSTISEVITHIKNRNKPSFARASITRRLKNKFEENGDTKEAKPTKKDKDIENFVDLAHKSEEEIINNVKNKLTTDYLKPLESLVKLSEEQTIEEILDISKIKAQIRIVKKIIDAL